MPPDAHDAGQLYDDLFADYLRLTEPLLTLTTTGVFHDRDRQHTDLWVGVLQRLLRAHTSPRGMFDEAVDNARLYPAALLMRAAGIVATHLHRDDVLLRLFTEPTWQHIGAAGGRLIPAHDALDHYRVAKQDIVEAMPRWKGEGLWYAASHLLRNDLREVLRPFLEDDQEYRLACNRYEFRVAIINASTSDFGGAPFVEPGEYLLRSMWVGETLPTAVEFREEASHAENHWPWWPHIGGREGHRTYLDSVEAALKNMRRQYG